MNSLMNVRKQRAQAACYSQGLSWGYQYFMKAFDNYDCATIVLGTVGKSGEVLRNSYACPLCWPFQLYAQFRDATVADEHLGQTCFQAAQLFYVQLVKWCPVEVFF